MSLCSSHCFFLLEYRTRHLTGRWTGSKGPREFNALEAAARFYARCFRRTSRGPARDRRSGADQSFIDDSLAGNGVLAPERLPEPVVAVEPISDAEQALDGRDVRLALGHRIETAGIGEGVEIEGAVVAVVPDLAEQLKRSTHMHRSHHEPVITLGVTVVQVHAEKPAAAMDEVGRKGWLLARVKSVGEVYRHAE